VKSRGLRAICVFPSIAPCYVRRVKPFRLLPPLGLLLIVGFQCRPIGPPTGGPDRWTPSPNVRPVSAGGQTAKPGGMSTSRMLREVNLKVDMVRSGTHGRKVVRPMTPRYITIHSTQNYTADAERHSLALKRGALRSPKTRTGNRIGYLIWHYTVDDRVAIQHMPLNEQGEHADFNGPGNRLSVGIEMCEHRGSNRAATMDRTAKLTAVLMKQRGIPLRNVVPHYHWPRKGRNPPNKNCPHFLLDNGRPGAKWRQFLARVNHHYKRLE
jgi:N-acetylmuramoyl-L-alanine amidase